VTSSFLVIPGLSPFRSFLEVRYFQITVIVIVFCGTDEGKCDGRRWSENSRTDCWFHGLVCILYRVERNVIRTTNRPTICTLSDTVVINCFMNRRAVSTLSLAVETGM
jgi:hypothetical protein